MSGVRARSRRETFLADPNKAVAKKRVPGSDASDAGSQSRLASRRAAASATTTATRARPGPLDLPPTPASLGGASGYSASGMSEPPTPAVTFEGDQWRASSPEPSVKSAAGTNKADEEKEEKEKEEKKKKATATKTRAKMAEVAVKALAAARKEMVPPPTANRMMIHGEVGELRKEIERMKLREQARNEREKSTGVSNESLGEQVRALQAAFDTVSDVVVDECDKVRASARATSDELRRQQRQLAHTQKAQFARMEETLRAFTRAHDDRARAEDGSARALLERVHDLERDVGMLKASYAGIRGRG